jgi:hypothetical protein
VPAVHGLVAIGLDGDGVLEIYAGKRNAARPYC